MEEDINHTFLKKIGLTGSEIKVYLALLKFGDSQKGKLIKESKISSSKVYEVTAKLIDKGLCSIITKNNVKHFMAAPPSRIKDYLTKKRDEILQEERELDKIMPKLESYHNQILSEVNIEVFVGWKGMETVYVNLLNLAKRNQDVYIIGAGTSKNEQKLELFYTKYGKLAFSKNLNIKSIFNEDARAYIKRIEKNIKRKYNKRFLFEHTPTEMLIFKEFVSIIIRREEPLVILIKDRETSDSFKKYFYELWRIAKK
mgnify:CR=1 FL=1